MEDYSDIHEYFEDYKKTLCSIRDATSYFEELTDDAYVEVAVLLPKIHSGLDNTVHKLHEAVGVLKDRGLNNGALSEVNERLAKLTLIPAKILEIMQSLQVQDAVKQSIHHILSSIELTCDYINNEDTLKVDDDLLKLIKYFYILPRLIIPQLERVYNTVERSLIDLQGRFQKIFQVLLPSLTMEQLLNGESERNIVQIIKDDISKLKREVTLKETLSALQDTISLLDATESSIPDNTRLIDIAAASTQILDQPLAEVLLLKDKLLKSSMRAKELLGEIFSGDISDLDCNDRLRVVTAIFTSKSEIEAIMPVFEDLGINISIESDELLL